MPKLASIEEEVDAGARTPHADTVLTVPYVWRMETRAEPLGRSDTASIVCFG